mgnify:CR=1 FL=1
MRGVKKVLQKYMNGDRIKPIVEQALSHMWRQRFIRIAAQAKEGCLRRWSEALTKQTAFFCGIACRKMPSNESDTKGS